MTALEPFVKLGEAGGLNPTIIMMMLIITMIIIMLLMITMMMKMMMKTTFKGTTPVGFVWGYFLLFGLFY